MMRMILDKIVLSFLVLITMLSCNSKTEAAKEETKTEDKALVVLNKEQFKIAEITLGDFEMKNLSGAIKVNGMLDVPPQNLISISPPIGAFLKSTEMLQGMKVSKGQVIAVMQNADFIQMQQDYMEAKSQLEFLEADYKRQGELAKDNVNSKKTFLQAKTLYQSMLAKVNGLKAKLNLLNINIGQIELGQFQNTITMYAPISGYVTQVNVNIGMYVNPTDVMFKIVDTEHLHAELTVFEKDVPQLKIGQKVRFTLANENDERMATVYLIGREIQSDRTVRIHCHLDKEDRELLPGMYLKAYVEAGTKSVAALPEKSVVEFEGKNYIFIEQMANTDDVHTFKMIVVEKGAVEMEYVEIKPIDAVPLGAKIVINGAYDILAKMKNTEEE
jgi:membrane fusion protein, heavy metal efflux system